MVTATISIKPQTLSQKSAWITGILSFVIPFGGYLYTSRYTPALISAIIWISGLMTSNPDDPSDPMTAVVSILMFIAAIENTIAVLRAKKSRRDTEQETTEYQYVDNLQVQLLKLAQNKEGVTIADCIIATGKTADEIRKIMQEFERQDLMRSGNRESDGAVFYRVV